MWTAINPEVKKIVDAIDKKIRGNDLKSARSDLRELVKKTISREDKASVAALSRRLRVCDTGLRILFPIVRSPTPLKPPATAEEKGEYGALLYRLGATSEAETLLREISPAEFNKAPLYLAFLLQSRWAYGDALASLTLFLRANDPNSYDALIAGVNWCAAAIFLKRHDEAQSKLTELLTTAQSSGAKLLQMNLLELSAQNEIGRKQFAKAREFLEQAHDLASGVDSLDTFFVEKWRALLPLIETESAASAQVVLELKKKAQAIGHWETVRDIDWHLGRYGAAEERSSRLNQVYWGTPYGDFRRRVLEETAEWWRPDGEFILTHEGAASCAWLDVTSGQTNLAKKVLKPNQVPHRLLVALTQDFYKPLRLMALHDLIFPGEYFSPQSSPGRIHQATHRLKQFFVESGLPLTVKEANGFFSLGFTGGRVALRGFTQSKSSVEKERPTVQARELVAQLPDAWQTRPFSAGEAAQRLNLPKRTLGRHLGDAVRGQLLLKHGEGKLTQYQISAPRQKS